MESLEKSFLHPGAEFRGAPFWAWNGKLDPETCRHQVRLMHDGGLGGFFMHSRTGLGTPYLSDEWFDCIGACVDEAKKLGMRAWLYDEDRWPSGAAGSLVTKDPKYRARSLFLYVCPGGLVPAAFGKGKGAKVTAAFLKETKACVAFTAKIDGRKAADVRRVAAGADPAPAKGECVVFAKIDSDATSSWYNGATYLDTLNPEATARFIEVTHDAYAKKLGKDIGGVVPGIFTDEPNHHPVVGSAQPGKNGVALLHQLAWTDKLPAAFKKLAGYDLVPRVLELVYDVDGVDSRRLRYDFNNCLTELFVKGFVKQIGDWCGRNKCDFTGHMLAEDTLANQTDTVGSCMRCYEYMQAPGMDMLTERWRIFKTAKQVSSASHQFGKKWRLSETYGCTGWDFPFAGHKALGDWQFALGINLRCQHLAWYTMKGQAKRDYPAAIFYQSPWWNFYGKVEDYFGRVGSVMTRGEEVRDILLLHPVESVWTFTSAGWRDDPRLKGLEYSFASLTDQLLAAHLDFDYGDEDILARHGKVAAGGKDCAAALKVGKATYKAVVVPSMLTIRSTTLTLLKRFAAKGGLVVFAGDIPGLVDARPSESAAEFAAAMPQPTGSALELLLGAKCRRVSIADAATAAEFGAALYLLREDADYSYLFICNTGEKFYGGETAYGHGGIDAFANLCRDRREACAAAVTVACAAAGGVFELDPETGAIHAATATVRKDGVVIATSLPALGSRLFVIAKTRKARLAASGAKPFAGKTVSTEPLAASFEPRPSEANVVVLDHPSYKVANGKWQAELEILRLDHKLRESLGRERRGGHMTQPWKTPPKANPKRIDLSLRYAFDVEKVPGGDFAVCLESPENFRLRLNGVPIERTGDCGWWTDTSLRRIRIDPSLLKKGENILEADVDFNENFSGLEIIYLLGSFGTKITGVNRVAIVAAPTSLKVGDLTDQGYAFYGGNMGYAAMVTPVFKKGERVSVKCGAYRGTAVRVLVDGHPAGVVAWDPNEVDVTDFVESGKPAEIVVELLGSRRNSHGALHYAEQWPSWHGPNTFEFYPECAQLWKDGYNTVPFGLMEPPSLVVSE